VIEALSGLVVGLDPMRSEFILAHLNTNTRQSRGGLIHQAMAAIENALLDIRGKALGVPVHALFGGPVRERIPVYWSHFGTYRVMVPEHYEGSVPRTYDELASQAADVKSRGFRALKTNIIPFDGQRLVPFNPGFGVTKGHPELNWDNALLHTIKRQLGVIREAIGPEMGLMLDVNFHFKTEGFRRVADAVAPFALTWLEMDMHDAPAMALIRRGAPCPIAACETLVGRRDFKPFFEAYAADTAIIDVVWNGLGESLKIAAMAEVYETNVAPHNFYGHLSTMISAHFAAIVPNLRIMEIDIDSVSWRDEFYTGAPVIENSEMVLPTAPGWGLDVNEEAVRARPPRH
jgi:L-alanine-DL-glutamate epimerase-like enolase superfamily enzyme